MQQFAFTSRYNGKSSVLINKVKIGIPESISIKKKQPISDIKALWDTGATGSVISKKIVESLLLKPTGMTQSSGVHGVKTVNTYEVDIFLPNNVVIPEVTVIESTNLKNFDVLIGMNIITLGDFAISNRDGKTVFSFRMPSMEEIDFVPEAQAHNLKQSGLNRAQRRRLEIEQKKKKS